jgi:hypothetical protein
MIEQKAGGGRSTSAGRERERGSDEGEPDGEVDALVLAALDAGGEGGAMAGGDGDAGVVEVKGADEGGDDRLVLKEGKAHADADAGALGEGDEAAPAAAHVLGGGHAALAGGAVAGLGGAAAADEPAGGAEDVGVVEDVLVAVDADRGDVDDLAALDGDRLDPCAVGAADRVPERDHVVGLGDLFVAGRGGEHAHDLFADGVEVGEAVWVGKVVVGGLALDGHELLAELCLDIWVLSKGPCREGEGRRRGFVAGDTILF